MSIYKNGKLIAGGRQCMPLLSFMWADRVLNDASWLRADTFSWQTGAVYQAAYQHLVDDIDIPVYAWYNSDLGVAYSTSESPQVGEELGGKDSSGFLRFLYSIVSVSGNTVTTGMGDIWTRQPESDSTAFIQPTLTETIAGTTITYYLADDGHKIVRANQESNVDAIYNAIGVAWYYIIDTTNQRFKLPRTKFGFTGIRSGVGGFVEAGLPNIMATWSSDNRDGSAYHESATGTVTQSTKSNWTFAGGSAYSTSYKNTLDASRSSSVYGNSSTVQPKATEMYLYFYVGDFTQTALENTAGVTTEVLNDKVDKGHQVVEFQAPTSTNNYTWYRKYADGWVEQGGRIGTGVSSVTIPVEMSDSDYQAIITWRKMSGNTNTPTFQNIGSLTQTATGFTVTTAQTFSRNWYIMGIAAQ